MNDELIPIICIKFTEYSIRLENDVKIFWDTNEIKTSFSDALKAVGARKKMLDSFEGLDEIEHRKSYVVIEKRTIQRFEYFKMK